MHGSDREARNEMAADIRSKMAESLAEVWMKGDRKLVKQTIDCALDASMSRQWKDDTAAALPETERDNFLTYMRG